MLKRIIVKLTMKVDILSFNSSAISVNEAVRYELAPMDMNIRINRPSDKRTTPGGDHSRIL